VKFVHGDDPASFAAAIDENTKAIYVESIGNPKYNVASIPELAKLGVKRVSYGSGPHRAAMGLLRRIADASAADYWARRWAAGPRRSKGAS